MFQKLYGKAGLSLLSVLLIHVSVFAQQDNIKDLRSLFDHLRGLKAYSYENHTNFVFPNGKKESVVTKIFMDKTLECLSYSNKGETVLLNRKWVYKANHISKIAQVFDLAAYNKRNKKILPELQSLFQYDLSAEFVDSIIMKYGKLIASEKSGALTTYHIGFKPEAAIKQIDIVYDDTRQLPESIYIKMLTETAGKKMQTEIACNNYKAVIPTEIFNEHAFFSIVQGKVVLAQYKNYKVYSLL